MPYPPKYGTEGKGGEGIKDHDTVWCEFQDRCPDLRTMEAKWEQLYRTVRECENEEYKTGNPYVACGMTEVLKEMEHIHEPRLALLLRRFEL